MWFDIQRSELEYCDVSPFTLEHKRTIVARPERVFDVFANGEGQERWFHDFRECRWTSEEPRGVGSTREIELAMLTVRERFLVWDRGQRITFSIDAITLPIVRAMVEDMHFAPSGDDGTEITWRVHYTPAPAMRIVHPIARAVFGRMFRLSLEGLARYVETGA